MHLYWGGFSVSCLLGSYFVLLGIHLYVKGVTRYRTGNRAVILTVYVESLRFCEGRPCRGLIRHATAVMRQWRSNSIAYISLHRRAQSSYRPMNLCGGTFVWSIQQVWQVFHDPLFIVKYAFKGESSEDRNVFSKGVNGRLIPWVQS